MTIHHYKIKSINITSAQKWQAEGYNGVAFVNAGDKIVYINEVPIYPSKGVSFMTENLLAKDCSEYAIDFEAGATITKLVAFYRETELCKV